MTWTREAGSYYKAAGRAEKRQWIRPRASFKPCPTSAGIAVTNPNTAALDYAKNSELAIEDADGNPTTPKALYEAYMASNITNVPAEVLQKGHRIEDVGDALPLYDQIWTEVKGE